MRRRKSGFAVLTAVFLALTCFFACTVSGTSFGTDSGSGETENGRGPKLISEKKENSMNEAYTPAYIYGTDSLGRTLPRISGYRQDRYVGMFYFLWHGNTGKQDRLYNITQLLKTEPEALWELDPKKGGTEINAVYYFNEPLYGYYRSDDPYIIRKHLELMTDAGVDFIALDFTNAIFYGKALTALLDVYLEYAEAGRKVPQIMFFLNLDSGSMASRLIREYYSKEEYDCLWFRGGGEKPLLIAWEDQLSKKAKEYFNVRPPQWPNEEFLENGFPYVDLEKPSRLHQNLMCVSVAQQTGNAFSFSLMMPGKQAADGSEYWTSRGRGYSTSHPANGDISAILRGDNIQEEWDHAIAVDPEMIFVTGWNEWVAQKLTADWADGTPYWVDTFNTEFSRDIEMTVAAGYTEGPDGTFSSEGYGDNYYWQLVENIRKYKGIPETETGADAIVSVKTDGTGLAPDPSSEEFWSGAAFYQNTAAAVYGRDWDGSMADGSLHYTQKEAENFVRGIRVTQDEENLYFRLETDKAASGVGENGILSLMLGFGKGEEKNWNGFSYRITGETVEKIGENGSYSFRPAEDRASCRASDSTVIYTVPKKALGIGREDFELLFKVCDSVEHPEEILDYYVSGCCVPLGRGAFLFRGTGIPAGGAKENRKKWGVWVLTAVGIGAIGAAAGVLISKRNKKNQEEKK